MRIALCDDSSADRALIRNILKSYAKTREYEFLYDEYDTGQEIVGKLKNGEYPDIILLDINMDDMDGLETARRIKQILPEIPIILVTAFMSYALDGYKVKANRFLVKDDLTITLPDCMDDMIEELSEKQRELTFDFIEGMRRLRLDDITYIESLGHTAIYHCMGNTYRQNRSLGDIENALYPYDFIRVHKSYIVNLRYIAKISNYSLTMQDGTIVSVPRSHYSEVKSAYATYRGEHM